MTGSETFVPDPGSSNLSAQKNGKGFSPLRFVLPLVVMAAMFFIASGQIEGYIEQVLQQQLATALEADVVVSGLTYSPLSQSGGIGHVTITDDKAPYSYEFAVDQLTFDIPVASILSGDVQIRRVTLPSPDLKLVVTRGEGASSGSTLKQEVKAAAAKQLGRLFDRLLDRPEPEVKAAPDLSTQSDWQNPEEKDLRIGVLRIHDGCCEVTQVGGGRPDFVAMFDHIEYSNQDVSPVTLYRMLDGADMSAAMTVEGHETKLTKVGSTAPGQVHLDNVDVDVLTSYFGSPNGLKLASGAIEVDCQHQGPPEMHFDVTLHDPSIEPVGDRPAERILLGTLNGLVQDLRPNGQPLKLSFRVGAPELAENEDLEGLLANAWLGFWSDMIPDLSRIGR